MMPLPGTEGISAEATLNKRESVYTLAPATLAKAAVAKNKSPAALNAMSPLNKCQLPITPVVGRKPSNFITEQPASGKAPQVVKLIRGLAVAGVVTLGSRVTRIAYTRP